MKTLLLFIPLLISLCSSCAQKKPSTFEIHYAPNRTDSAVLVNHHVSTTQTCSFYIGYHEFFRLYRKNNMDEIYDYYLKHKKRRLSQAKYTHFMALKYCYHHRSDTVQYEAGPDYSDVFSEKPEFKKEYVSPKMPYHQPTRGH